MIYFKNVDFKTRDFSPFMKWLLGGVYLVSNCHNIEKIIFLFQSSTDLTKNYIDDEDSFRVVFEVPSDDSEQDEAESESDGGIVFKDETPDPQILQKPAPSR